MMRPSANARDKTTSMKKLRKQSGFTLIEVLIALTIFAVGLLAIAAMQTSAIRMNSTAGNVTEMTACSMGQLETLMGLPYTSSQLTTGNHSATPPSCPTINWTVAPAAAANTIVISLWMTNRGKMLRMTATKAQSL